MPSELISLSLSVTFSPAQRSVAVRLLADCGPQVWVWLLGDAEGLGWWG